MENQKKDASKPQPSSEQAPPHKSGKLWVILGCILVLCVALAGFRLWHYFEHKNDLPPHIEGSNGRLEMTRFDIAAKYAGRINELSFNEGDLVKSGQILAQQDDAETRAQRDAAQANLEQAQESVHRAEAEQAAAHAAAALAAKELMHTKQMASQSLVSDMELQNSQTAYTTRSLSEQASQHSVAAAKEAVKAASAQIARLDATLAEMTIRAPVSGQIEYRVAEQGSVLGQGGRLASLLDPSDIYLTVFFESAVAGKLHVGDEARIKLDALNKTLIPARISFVSPEAQFTPKFVETKTEREKLVYRVKLRIMPDTIRNLDGILKAGMTGIGYVRTDPSAQWPTLKQDRG
ncbi:MAG: HlyD family efflux transporter periplasmic adaptor subunit [Zymomonas mobilis]|uniref:HlyD family secretion protein n=1 Tax=Zymomonas mobilis TaxID=542 RepID=A0A542W117_ZYMMB|nr:HlyD family efflux transporter periplasmic adaptor subunit [Zymomonas mobilis]TQL17229.1 HlyD family secretion protein [Zymomonas mobilis]